MKSWEDLEMEITPKRLDLMNTVADIRKVLSGFDTESKRIWFFQTVISEKPQLINQYKHLVDSETLKEVLDINSLTKLYLK